MSASDYQCDEQDLFDLANDSMVASSASLQPLEAKLQRSPETPRVIGCLDTIGNAAEDLSSLSVIDSPWILSGAVSPINPPSQHRS